MNPLPLGRLARCDVDGLPLELRAYGEAVMVGCALDHIAAYNGPRIPFEPARAPTAPPRCVAPARVTCYGEAVVAWHNRTAGA